MDRQKVTNVVLAEKSANLRLTSHLEFAVSEQRTGVSTLFSVFYLLLKPRDAKAEPSSDVLGFSATLGAYNVAFRGPVATAE